METKKKYVTRGTDGLEKGTGMSEIHAGDREWMVGLGHGAAGGCGSHLGSGALHCVRGGLGDEEGTVTVGPSP